MLTVFTECKSRIDGRFARIVKTMKIPNPSPPSEILGAPLAPPFSKPDPSESSSGSASDCAAYGKKAAQDAAKVRGASPRKELDYGAWIDQFGPWRGPDARKAIQATLNRLAWLEADAQDAGQPLEIEGITPTILYLKKFVANRDVSDEQLVAIGQVKIEKLATPPDKAKDVVEKFPNYEQQPSHRMAVALLSALTDIPYDQLSKACPDLGFSGTANTRLWRPGEGIFEQLTPNFVASTEDFQLANVLHDTTDSLEQAGVAGMNQAVWGVDGSVGSAAYSVIRALFESPAE